MAHAVFELILTPIGAGDLFLGEHECIDEVLSVDLWECARQFAVSAYKTSAPDHRVAAVFHAVDLCDRLHAGSDPIEAIAAARDAWLERLFAAHQADQVPYIELLADLVRTTPGNEGKWFAAAKDAGLYDEALELARRTPCDPMTLARAARDFADTQPAFATNAGLLSLHWLVQGYGYEITSADVRAAYQATLDAGERLGVAAEVRQRIRDIVASENVGSFVGKVLGPEWGL